MEEELRRPDFEEEFEDQEDFKEERAVELPPREALLPERPAKEEPMSSSGKVDVEYKGQQLNLSPQMAQFVKQLKREEELPPPAMDQDTGRGDDIEDLTVEEMVEPAAPAFQEEEGSPADVGVIEELIETAWSERELEEYASDEPIIQESQSPSERVGNFTLLERVAQGGFCDVYRAKEDSGRTVCVKRLRDSGQVEQLLKQVKVNHRLEHPNILRIQQVDVDEPDGAWLMMEYMPEGHLDTKRFTQGKKLGEVLNFFEKICGVVGYAHREGVVHKDLKPANILVHNGDPYLTDFGVSSIFGLDLSQTIQTKIASHAGTFGYMAPEVETAAREERELPNSPKSDIYSLGVLLYELLTQGNLPGNSLEEELCGYDLPDEVIDIVKKATRRDPEQRYASVDELARDLSSVDVESMERVLQEFSVRAQGAGRNKSAMRARMSARMRRDGKEVSRKLASVFKELDCDVEFDLEVEHALRYEYSGRSSRSLGGGVRREGLVRAKYHAQQRVIDLYHGDEHYLSLHAQGQEGEWQLVRLDPRVKFERGLPKTSENVQEFFDMLAKNVGLGESLKSAQVAHLHEVLSVLPDELLRVYQEHRPGALEKVLKRDRAIQVGSSEKGSLKDKRARAMRTAKRRGKNLESRLRTLCDGMAADSFVTESDDGLRVEYQRAGRKHSFVLRKDGLHVCDVEKGKKWLLLNYVKVQDVAWSSLGLPASKELSVSELLQRFQRHPVAGDSDAHRERQSLLTYLEALPGIVTAHLEGKSKDVKARLRDELLEDIVPGLMDACALAKQGEEYAYRLGLDKPFVHRYGSSASHVTSKHREVLVRSSGDGGFGIYVGEFDKVPIMTVSQGEVRLEKSYYALAPLSLPSKSSLELFAKRLADRPLKGNEEAILDILRKLRAPKPGEDGAHVPPVSRPAQVGGEPQLVSRLYSALMKCVPHPIEKTIHLKKPFVRRADGREITTSKLVLRYSTSDRTSVELYWPEHYLRDRAPLIRFMREKVEFPGELSFVRELLPCRELRPHEFFSGAEWVSGSGEGVAGRQMESILEFLEGLEEVLDGKKERPEGPMTLAQKEEGRKIYRRYLEVIVPALSDLAGVGLPRSLECCLELDQPWVSCPRGVNAKDRWEYHKRMDAKVVTEDGKRTVSVSLPGIASPRIVLEGNTLHFREGTGYLPLDAEVSLDRFFEYVSSHPPLGESYEARIYRCVMDVLEKLPSALEAQIGGEAGVEASMDAIRSAQTSWAHELQDEYYRRIKPGFLDLADLQCADFEFSLEIEHPYLEKRGKMVDEHKELYARYDSRKKRFAVVTEGGLPVIEVDSSLDLHIPSYKVLNKELELSGDTTVHAFVDHLSRVRPIGSSQEARQYLAFYDIIRALPDLAKEAVRKEYGQDA